MLFVNWVEPLSENHFINSITAAAAGELAIIAQRHTTLGHQHAIMQTSVVGMAMPTSASGALEWWQIMSILL
jgi:hypothetical protein